jgi:hypothetical protein
MFGYAVGIFLLAAALMVLATDPAPAESQALRAYRTQAIAANLGVYNTAVIDYAIANPASTGTIAVASLPLPVWFTATNFTHSILADGTVRVWLDPSAGGFAENAQILEDLNTQLRGYEDFGRVATTGFTHPVIGFKAAASAVASIPVNSIAILTKVR